MDRIPFVELSNERFDEITAVVRAYVEKNGWKAVCSIGHLWECLHELNEDGSQRRRDCDVPDRAREDAARLMAETKIPRGELYTWAVEQDENDSEAQDFCGPGDGMPPMSLEALDRMTDAMIARGLL